MSRKMCTLTLPYPDEHYEYLFRQTPGKIRKHGSLVLAEIARLGGAPVTKPWVAKIERKDNRIHRTFLRGQKDYEHADEMGARGVVVHFFLCDGREYEARFVDDGGYEHRVVYRVVDGSLEQKGKE